MDLSKLPKLSKTSEVQPPPQTPAEIPQPGAPTNIQYAAPRTPGGIEPGIGADIWFNAVIGLLCIFLGRTFGAYLLARLTGQPFHTHVFWQSGDKSGQEVSYSQLEGHVMLTDAGVFFFGVVVLLESVVKSLFAMQRRFPRILAGAVLVLAIFSTAINLYASYLLMRDGTIPLISGLAVAFGGYIVADARRILAVTRPVR